MAENGRQVWYPTRSNKIYRMDGHAIISHDSKHSYQMTKNENGCNINKDGQFWYKNGKIHKKNGPAVIFSDGTQHWCEDGKLHRVDGPAVTKSDGTEEWWIEGKQLNQQAVHLIQKMIEEKKEQFYTRIIYDPEIQTAMLFGDRETLTSDN